MIAPGAIVSTGNRAANKIDKVSTQGHTRETEKERERERSQWKISHILKSKEGFLLQ